MTYPQYIVASPEVEINFTYGSNVLSVATGTSLSINYAQDVQNIFAIGQKSPIGVKSLNQTYTGTLTLQSGEYEAILDAINSGLPAGQFIASLLDLDSFSIGWTMRTSGATPKTIIYSLDNCSVNSADSSVDRNSPETLSNLAFQGTGITRIVRNL